MKSNQSSSYTLRTRGFTLVELLVVIAIVAVLAALVFSISRNALQRAATTKTLNSLKQLQLANGLYASDHNGSYVPPKGGTDPNAWSAMWFLNSSFTSGLGLTDANWDEKYPEAATSGHKSARSPSEPKNATRGRFSIAINNGTRQHWGNSSGVLGSMSFHTSQINHPARAMAFCDANDFWVAAGSGSWSGWTSDAAPWGGMKMAYRNNGKAAVVHFDGSTSLVTPAQSANNMYLWDPTRP